MSDAGKVHSEIGKGIGYGVAAVIALAIVALVAAFVFGAFSDGTVERRGQTAQQEATVGDAAWRVAQYDRFFTGCQAIVTVEAQIAAARASGPDDPFFDRRELRAMENQRLELIGRYNADAARTATAGAFRDAGLPASVDPRGETRCAR